MKQKAILAILATGGLVASLNAQQVDTLLITNAIYEPMGVAATADYVYVTASVSNRIVRFDPGTGTMDLLAGSAQGLPGFVNATHGSQTRFYNPQGIITARGGLVVSDSGNHVLRLVSFSGGVSTLAGVGTNDALVNGSRLTAKFNNPVGMDIDASGNIYIADAGNGAIRVLHPDDTVSTLAAGFNQPYAVAVGTNGQIWVADTRNHVIRLIETVGSGSAITVVNISVVAGNSGFVSGGADAENALDAYFNGPRGLLWVGGVTGLLVSDTGNSVVRRVFANEVLGGYSSGLVAGAYGQKDYVNGAPTTARFRSPVGLCKDPVNGGFYVVDRENVAVRRLQTSPPQPRIRNPRIGYVRLVDSGFGLVARIFPVIQITFHDDEVLAVDSETGTQTFFTSGTTPADPLDTRSIPEPGPGVGSTPPPFVDGQYNMPPTMLGPSPDFIVKARSSAVGRQASEVVQARFIFQVATPTIFGDNAAYVPITNITSNARMFYTTNGVDPVEGAGPDNFGPIFSGEILQIPVVETNVTLKLRGFRDKFKPSEVSSKIFTPESYSANKITFGFEGGEASSSFVAAPGQRFLAPVTLSLVPGQTIYSLQFNLGVDDTGSTPVNPASMGFRTMLKKPVDVLGMRVYVPIEPSFYYYQTLVGTNMVTIWNPGLITNTATAKLLVGWVERYSFTNLYNTLQQHLVSYSLAHNTLVEADKEQKVILGGFSFQVPATATPSDQYQITVGRPSGTSDGIERDVFIDTPTNGAILAVQNVTIGQKTYVVGDSSPFRWFNAGDFGDSNLLSADIMQVFQSAIYGINTPPSTTDYFDSMDSCCTDINGVDQSGNALFVSSNGVDTIIDTLALGSGTLDVNDIYVTLRRSLDPSRTWYARYWPTTGATGARQYLVISNQFRGLPGADDQAIEFTINRDAGDPMVKIAAGDAVQAEAGTTLQIPINAQISGGLALRVFWLNLSVEALDGSPAIVDPVSFVPSTAIGNPSLTTSRGAASFAGCWLNPAIEGIAESGTLGHLVVKLPPGTPTSASYAVHIGSFSGSPNGVGLFQCDRADGLITLSDRSGSSLADGIPDSWRLRFFGTIQNQLSHALADADGDGIPNWQEFKAGTNPNDAASKLQLLVKRLAGAANGDFVLRWPSVAGKTYVIEVSDNLLGDNWTIVAEGVVGDGFMREFRESNPTTDKRFYRVRLSE